jgi:hypothetical protein
MSRRRDLFLCYFRFNHSVFGGIILGLEEGINVIQAVGILLDFFRNRYTSFPGENWGLDDQRQRS